MHSLDAYIGVRQPDGNWVFHLPMGAKLARFRDERVAAILTGGIPVSLSPTLPLVVLHIVPAGVFADSDRLLPSASAPGQTNLPPLDAHGWDGRNNFDGYVTYSSNSGQPPSIDSYLQVYHTGAIEAVAARLIDYSDDLQDRAFAGSYFERQVIETTERYLQVTEKLNVQTPFYFFLSLLRVRGYRIQADGRLRNHPGREFDRDHLLVPALELTGGDDVPTALKPSFDRVWQSGGWGKSPCYDQGGHRIAEHR